jgi:mRNA interferase MazF
MSYVPNRGDIVWMNFTPQAGHEQKGTRPVLILSPEKYNRKTGLAVCCPITSNAKGYPFEVVVSGEKISGVALSDHLKNLDWKIRKAKFIERASQEAVDECSKKVSALIIQEQS